MIRCLVPGKLWVGAREDAEALCATGREGWIAFGLRAVLCVAHNVRIAYHERIPAMILPVDDYDTVPPWWFELAVVFHQRTGGATLVHCNGGKNRSVAFALAISACERVGLDEGIAVLNEPTPPLLESVRRWRATLP